jgi:hypothetical protein
MNLSVRFLSSIAMVRMVMALNFEHSKARAARTGYAQPRLWCRFQKFGKFYGESCGFVNFPSIHH